ncbi:MAG: molybdopterin-dependent oxidoreductase [Planctomycetes bacterium]|nr:molybdopterin-dependent oxidoreductase [Planctomycetota bacterium]
MPASSSPIDRRDFLKGASLGSLTAALGAAIPFAALMPEGLMPVALADVPETDMMKTKDGLILLADKPVNAETPAHLLDDAVTPSNRHFVRNHGFVPEAAIKQDAAGWTLTIDGQVDRPMTLSIDDLKKDFEVVTQQLVIECAGNGRAFYSPGASGNQWTTGAVACSQWTGVRLRDVLNKAGVKKSAVYTGHHSADVHLSRLPGKEALSRGVPIEKAMDEKNLIAFAQNGAAIPPLNGFPLRLVVPGWAGSCSQKWLTRVELRDKVHDGEKMLAPAYMMPKHPVAPGETVADDNWVIMSSLPVKSVITSPRTGLKVDAKKELEVRGHAWAGDRLVEKMHISIDFGATWIPASLDKPVNPGAWHNWRAKIALPEAGYYEIWACATDDQGVAQPPVTPGWNPKGYLNNMQHRIAVFAS